jgi:hypothetical protein
LHVRRPATMMTARIGMARANWIGVREPPKHSDLVLARIFGVVDWS